MPKKAVDHRHHKESSLMTHACKGYLDYENKALRLFIFIINLAEKADLVSHTAAVALAKVYEKPEPENKNATMTHLRTNHLGLLFEILLSKLIDNYQKYLADILFEIFIQKPETLKSKASVEVEEVLNCDSIEVFVRRYAENKVDDLAYKSFSDLQEFFKEKFGILVTDKSDSISLAIEIRNISVHNRCIINKRFISKTKEDLKNEGTVKKIDGKFLTNILEILRKSVIEIDKQAMKKFNVKGKRFKASAQQKPVSNK